MPKLLAQMLILIAAAAASFCVGTLWQQSKAGHPTPVRDESAQSRPASPSPLERMQLDNACAQSAQAYFNENKITMFDESEFEHGYNYQLNQCFILISYFTNGGHGVDHAGMIQWLYETATGKEYGDFRTTYGPVNGTSQETVTRCSIFEYGGDVEKKCKSRESWKAYKDYMLHDD